MKRAALLAGLVCGAGALVTARQQTFRTATDVVMVDVSVREGGRFVTGLSADRFVLMDNGVRQKVESVEATAVPLDVTLVVDLSGSPGRPWRQPRLDPEEPKSVIRRELADVTAILRPTDRVRLLTVDRYVRQVFPFVSRDQIPPIAALEFDGIAALFDGLAAALMQPVEPARRHVIVARTKGADGMSVIDASHVASIAARSDAQLHVVAMEMADDDDQVLALFQCGTPLGNPLAPGVANVAEGFSISQPMGLCTPTNRYAVPPMRRLFAPGSHDLLPRGLTIQAGARTTGGDWYQSLLFAEPTLTSTFRNAFENFRTSYVLRYTPEGVVRGGWHAIQVAVPSARSYQVNARRGYGIEEPQPKRAAVVPAPDAILTTVAELTEAYERAAYAQVTASVRRAADPARLLHDFAAGGNPWPGNPRREAVFALELLEPAVFSSRTPVQEEAQRLLDRLKRWVHQPLEPDEFEREWFFAALSLLQGAIRPGDLEQYFSYAVGRFAGDPRFLLLQAINTEQRSVAAPRATALQQPGAPRAIATELARQQYEAAAAFPGTAAEAQIRLGWLLHRSGKSDEALGPLDAAEALTSRDPQLSYLQQLLSGHVLLRLNRVREAISRFGRAMEVVPAQSARVALMNALTLNGERDGAVALSASIQTDRRQVQDPWWTYWQGLYRVHPQALQRVREMAK